MFNGITELIIWLYERLSDLGSVASILGLVITLVVFYRIRKLETHFLFTARIPEHIEQLHEHVLKIAELLQNFDRSSRDIRVELALCEANLKSLKPKLHGEARKSVMKLTRLIIKQRESVTRQSAEQIEKIHEELIKVTRELENLLEDERWRH
ncbi:hypothetical protein HYR99_17035 [Candidatus Poribacteria bacterium]|nr:hypothetical protein [Candidatus Poribacteria bacterium]